MGLKAKAMMAASGVKLITDEPTIQPLLERGVALRMTAPLKLLNKKGIKTIKIVKDTSKIPEDYKNKKKVELLGMVGLKEGGNETIAHKGSDVIVSVGDLLDEKNIEDNVRSDDGSLKKLYKEFLSSLVHNVYIYGIK